MNILFLVDSEEKNYLPALKKIIQEQIPKTGDKVNVTISFDRPESKAEFDTTTRKYSHVIISNPRVSSLVCPPGISAFDCRGSLYAGGRILIVSSLSHIYTIPYGSWLLSRDLSKILSPHKWIKFPKFRYARIKDDFQHLAAVEFLKDCLAISTDIETIKSELSITCCSFSGISRRGEIRTFVYSCFDSERFIYWIKEINNLSPPKIFQRGLYDNQYFLRWDAPVYNFAFDTLGFMHSHYSELPKDLGFLSSINIRDFEFWKHEGRKAENHEEYLAYCAKDSWSTLCIAINQLLSAPAWAKKNFYSQFPLVFPCILSSIQGIKVDEKKRNEICQEAEKKLAQKEAELKTMVGAPSFNPRSPKQVKSLFKLFGFDTPTDEKSLDKVANAHPLMERFVSTILECRRDSKAISTYYRAALLSGRLLYDLDPFATETSRFASKESSFWCGSNIQNQPTYAERYLQADSGFLWGEVDGEQAETWCTAFISQEPTLLKVLGSGKSFHTSNMELYFGIAYEDAKRMVDEYKKNRKAGELQEHPLRYLAKRINHGKSYNMGARTFVSSSTHHGQSGIRTMYMARKNLNLPETWSPERVAEYLLSLFDKTYPGISKEWYPRIVKEISFTNKLVGPTGWTRYFFTLPTANKHALNSAIAHGPQCLSVQIINKGYLRVFHEIALPDGGENFRLCAQRHDSILFQFRKGREDLVEKVRELMKNPVIVHGKELIIPTAAKMPGEYLG